MHNDVFLEEFFARLQSSVANKSIVRTLKNGIVVNSEDTCNVILACMELIGLRKYILVSPVGSEPVQEWEISYDLEASKPDYLVTEGKLYIVKFMLGSHESERHGYNSIEDACDSACTFYELRCRRRLHAEVERINGCGEYETILWCNDDREFENLLDEDDPDFAAIESAYENIFNS